MITALKDKHYNSIGERWKLIPSYIDYLLANHRFDKDKPPTIVVDLDGTLKPSHPNLQEIGLFPNVKEILGQITNGNVTIHLITARTDDKRNLTLRYLDEQGILSFLKQLHFMPMDKSDRIQFKSETRDLIRRNHSIIMCCGDQRQDLSHNDTGDDIEGEICLNMLFENPFTIE